jgi:hypothetical protein
MPKRDAPTDIPITTHSLRPKTIVFSCRDSVRLEFDDIFYSSNTYMRRTRTCHEQMQRTTLHKHRKIEISL